MIKNKKMNRALGLLPVVAAFILGGCGQRTQNPAIAAKAATTGKALQEQAQASGIGSKQTEEGDNISKAMARRARVLSEQQGGK